MSGFFAKPRNPTYTNVCSRQVSSPASGCNPADKRILLPGYASLVQMDAYGETWRERGGFSKPSLRFPGGN